MEKIFTIPLRKEFLRAPKWKRSKRSVKSVKDFLKRHMKVIEVKLNAELNEALWENGARNPPSRVKVHALVKDEVAWANLADIAIAVPEKKGEKEKKEKKKEEEKEEEKGEGEANISRGEPEKKKSRKRKEKSKGGKK